MTVSTDIRRVQYATNGTTGPFAITFPYIENSHLAVTHTDSSSVETALVLNVDYTIALDAVTTAAAYPSGGQITITRDVPATQELDLRDGDAFPAESVETALDKVTMLAQQVVGDIGRAIRVPEISVVLPDLPPAATRANMLLAFDSEGDPTVLVPVSGSAADVLTQLADTISASLGDALNGTRNTATGGIARTEHDRNNEDLRSSDFSSLQDALTAAAGKTLRIMPGTHTLTQAVTILDNTNIILDPLAVLTTATPGISLFYASGKTNIHIKGAGKLEQTVANATAYVGAVHFLNCTECSVSGDIEFEGMQWAGVYIENGSHNKVSGGYFHGWLGAVNDAAAVIVYRDACDNIVEKIRAEATGWHGVLVQDPGGAGVYQPKRNKVRNCTIKTTTGYGIAVYTGGVYNHYNEVTGNYIEGVTGSASAAHGMGIYCVGNALGGLKVLDNTVVNCCISTTSTSNGPGGITVTNTAQGTVKPIVSGNTVQGMTQGTGILIVSCAGGCVLGPNTVDMPSSNDGTGAGGGALLGQALKIFNSVEVSVIGGDYDNNGVGDAVFVITTSGGLESISLQIGTGYAVAGCGLRTARTGADTITATISGGSFKTGGATNAIQLEGMIGPLSGVVATSLAGAALQVTNCLSLSIVGSRFTSTGATAVATAGTCTNSVLDKTNFLIGVINNAATGLKTETFASAAPASGTAAVGDRVDQSVPVVGNPKGWRCTVAGTPGTWVSEGNL